MNPEKQRNNEDKIILKKRVKHDIIEKKDIELNNIKNNTNDIKKSTIKEFIYSHKNVPKIWKTKKTYKNLILDIFAEDNNFLKYMGSNVEKEPNSPKNINIKRPKTTTFENRNVNYDLFKSKRSTNYKFGEPKKKIRLMTNSQIEIENIFDDLRDKYPIKKKLFELFPSYNFEDDKKSKTINASFNNYKTIKNSKLVENSVETNRLKKIKKMEKNIYNNIFMNYRKNIHYLTDGLSKKNDNDFDYKRRNRIKLMENELNDPKIFNILCKLNLYGPYFSYCPNCFDKNIDFYKNIGKSQCMSLLNYIKNDNFKKRKINQKKSIKNLIYNTNYF